MNQKHLFVLLGVLLTLDVLTTAWALSYGILEGNPLMAMYTPVLEVHILIKTIGLALFGVLALWTNQIQKGAGKYPLVAACLIFYTAGVWNLAYTMGAAL